MRYFLTTIASRPLEAGGRTFQFELVGNLGGSSLGVLACADEADANILASVCGGTLEEITADQYDVKKKRLSLSQSDSPGSRSSLKDSPLNHAVADRAGSLTPPFRDNGGPNSTDMITRVTVFSTAKSPPDEPILQGTSEKRRW